MAKLKLTKKLIEKASKLIQAGNYTVTVCNMLGIDESTWYKWIKKGKDDLENEKKSMYVQFFKSIQKAEAIAEARNVGIIQSAASSTWQAAAWYLERKHFDRWGRKEHHEITGKDGGAVEVEMARKKLLDKLTNMAEAEVEEND